MDIRRFSGGGVALTRTLDDESGHVSNSDISIGCKIKSFFRSSVTL